MHIDRSSSLSLSLSKIAPTETTITTTSRPRVKGKKVVGSRIQSWNHGYKPAGGNLKIYNKGLQFEDRERTIVEQEVTRIEPEQKEIEEVEIEVTTRPFEVERVSRTVKVTREMKKPRTPSPEPIQVNYTLYR